MVSDVRPRNMIGWSAGLNFRNDGGAGMPAGRSGITAAIAICTSTAALSMSRPRSNCSVTFVLPVELDEVISSTPAIVVNWRSSGLATAEAKHDQARRDRTPDEHLRNVHLCIVVPRARGAALSCRKESRRK